MITYRRNTLEQDVGWLLIWLVVVAMIVSLMVDFTEDQWLLDRRRDDAKLCLVYYTADGATGSQYGDCE